MIDHASVDSEAYVASRYGGEITNLITSARPRMSRFYQVNIIRRAELFNQQKRCHGLTPSLARKLTRLVHRHFQSSVRREIVFPLGLVTFVVVCVLCSGCQTLQTFKSASKTKVVSARNWARSGFEAMHQGRFQQAKTFFSKAAKDMPGDPRIMANLARSEFQQGHVARAIATMEQAVQQSDDPDLRCELGEFYLQSGQWIAANQHADKALEKDRRLSAAWSLKGKLAASKGEHQHALQMFQRSLEYETESDEIQMLIAQTYMKLEQPMRALSATETLLNRHPPDRQPERAIVAKSDALLAMDQHSTAIDILQVASNRSNSSKEIYFQLGKAQLQAGQRSQARLTLAKGKQRFPDEELFTQLAGTIIESPDEL